MDELTSATWIKSSYSGSSGGDCVEVASLAGERRGVRDSKNPAGPVLVVGRDGWHAFRRGVRNGGLA